MKYLLNLKNISALAYVKRVNFILFGAALLYMTSSLLCSCSGNLKGNADNDSNGTETVEQQSGEPEKNEKEQALETASTQMSRLSYTIKPKKDTKEIKTYVNKDGYMDVKWIFNSGSFNLFPFAREISRYVYIDGKQISYNPRFTSDELSVFVMKEVVFILTEKSLQGDPMVNKRRQEIDISQYLYYLIFGNEDANDFVRERVQMHYEVAMEQMLDEINYVHEVANSSASNFIFKFEPTLYKEKYEIEMWFDDNGYLAICSSLWNDL